MNLRNCIPVIVVFCILFCIIGITAYILHFSMHLLKVTNTKSLGFYYLFLMPHSIAPTSGSVSDLLCAHSSCRALRFPNQSFVTIVQTQMRLKGDQAFSVVALRWWNSLAFFNKGMSHGRHF